MMDFSTKVPHNSSQFHWTGARQCSGRNQAAWLCAIVLKIKHFIF